jgi:hypothetical protein
MSGLWYSAVDRVPILSSFETEKHNPLRFQEAFPLIQSKNKLLIQKLTSNQAGEALMNDVVYLAQ